MRATDDISALEPMLEAVRLYAPLDRESEHRLAKRSRRGDKEAQRLLVVHNLRLVLSVSRRFAGRGVRLDDLIQEGNIGLLKAIDHFDPDRGTRFSTYAVWWIRAYVQRHAREARGTVRMPATQPGEELRPIPRDISLDEPVDEGRDERRSDFLESDAPAPDEVVGQEEENEELRQALLGHRQKIGELGWDIINERLRSLDPCTLEELGHEWGLSRERVRQVERRTKAYLKEALAKFAA